MWISWTASMTVYVRHTLFDQRHDQRELLTN